MSVLFWKWIKRTVAGLLIFSLILVAFTWLAGTFAKAKLVREYPPPGKMVDLGGLQMHLYCAGNGSPSVVLEAGLNDFYVYWTKVQPEVAKFTRVCSYDRAGLGWSQASPRPRSNDVMVEELHTLLANAGETGPYILVGHSFGGINMRTFARRYPKEVAGMVLVDAAHEEQMARLPFLQDVTVQFISQFRTLSKISSFGLMALSPASIPNRGLPEDAYRQYQAVVATTTYFDGAIAESSAFYLSPPSVKIAGLGDLPLIVISHGLPDESIEWTDVQQNQFEHEWANMQSELLDLSSNSKQVIAENSGHYIQLDQPDLVIAAILELVQTVQNQFYFYGSTVSGPLSR